MLLGRDGILSRNLCMRGLDVASLVSKTWQCNRPNGSRERKWETACKGGLALWYVMVCCIAWEYVMWFCNGVLYDISA